MTTDDERADLLKRIDAALEDESRPSAIEPPGLDAAGTLDAEIDAVLDQHLRDNAGGVPRRRHPWRSARDAGCRRPDRGARRRKQRDRCVGAVLQRVYVVAVTRYGDPPRSLGFEDAELEQPPWRRCRDSRTAWQCSRTDYRCQALNEPL